jgi:hypothetical protein
MPASGHSNRAVKSAVPEEKVKWQGFKKRNTLLDWGLD